MDNNYVLNAIDKYFNQLYTKGSTSEETKKKVLILTHIQKLLCEIFMNEEDYKSILKYMENIVGDCIIPYPSYKQFINSSPIESRIKIRTTQEGIVRVDSGKELRISLY